MKKKIRGVRGVLSACLPLVLASLGACALEATDARGTAAERPGEVTATIIAGQVASPGEFPWMVDLHETFQGQDRHHCGGSLIDSQWVLTAAHCVAFTLRASDGVLVGGVDSTVIEAGEEVRHGAAIFIHPDRDSVQYRADLALIKLDAPITTIQPIRLARVAPPAGTFVTALGWGATRPGGYGGSDLLLKAVFPVVANATCAQAPKLTPPVFPEDLCTGYEDGRAATCSGDSGGPIIARAGDGSWELAGVTSRGALGCTSYNVSMRVSSYYGWIDTLVHPVKVDTPAVTPGMIAFAGTGSSISTGDGGLATAAGLSDPSDVAVTSDGTVYVLEAATNNIRRINPATGIIDTVFQGKPNMVRNGEGNQGPVGATTPEWVQSGTWKTAMDVACSGCGPDGEAYFTPNGGSGYIEQEIDVSSSAAAIDARQMAYSVSGIVGGQSGRARGSVTYVGATGTTVVSSFPISRTSAWNAFDAILTPTVGTRKLRLRLFADPPNGSTVSDTRYDKLMVREMSASTTLHRPSALAALGSKLYTVEFHTGTTYLITPGGTSRVALGPASGSSLGIGIRSLAAFDDYTVPGLPPAFVWTLANGSVSGSKFGTQSGWYHGTTFGADGNGAARSAAVSIVNGFSYISVTTVQGNVVQKVYTVGTPPALASSIAAYWGAAPGLVDNPTGSASQPRESFSLPTGIVPFPTGSAWPDFLIADTGNNAIRRISAGGSWNSGRFYALTLAGHGSAGWSGDGQLATQARLRAPNAIAVGPAPNNFVYVVDRGNNRIRKLACMTPNVCSSRVRFDVPSQACVTTSLTPSVAIDDNNVCTKDACEVDAIRHSWTPDLCIGPGSTPLPP